MNLKALHPIKSIKELRDIAANYMASHSEEFISFLTTNEGDDISIQGKNEIWLSTTLIKKMTINHFLKINMRLICMI